MDNTYFGPVSFHNNQEIRRNIFPASHHRPNHHPSQSLTQLSHDIDYSSMMNPQQTMHTQQPPNSSGFSRLPSANAYESHDDSCLNQCEIVGLYNGSQCLGHRGPSQGAHLAWPARGMSSRHDPGVLYHYSAGVDAYHPLSHRGSTHPSDSDVLSHTWYSSGLEPGHGGADDDCPSVDDSCCDIDCNMVGKCTNIACANKDDACTDQNCPIRPVAVPPEVVNGAAALISITHPPQSSHHDYSLQSPVMDNYGYGISHHSQQASLMPPDLLPNYFGDTFAPIIGHALVAHGDPGQSPCRRPCLLDNPSSYGNGNCHLPILYPNQELHNRFHSTMPDPSMQMNPKFEECGAEISNPEEFLQHFNEQHRLPYNQLFSSLQDSLQQFPRPQQGQAIASNDTHSRSPTTPFDTSDSGASANTPSPLTPLSHSVEMADARQARPSPSRSVTEESESGTVDMEADGEHRCLWRENPAGEVCGQIFATSGELFDHSVNRHIKHAVKGPDGFSCGWLDCPRSTQGASGFPQRSKIERHMQTHIGHKPHVCSICSKGFSAKQALNQHMYIHTEEKPLECEVCNKTFRYPSALTMHLRTHSKIKPLKCPVCGKSFSESSNLSKHKRTHEHRGRFSCAFPGCSRDFHRQDQLRRHAKTHYKETGSKPTTENMTLPKVESVF